MPELLVVTGPTATGKTALGVALAKLLGGEVVGADSMQIYRGMDIGTAKPTPQEMRGVRHHMIDVAEPSERFSAAKYAIARMDARWLRSSRKTNWTKNSSASCEMRWLIIGA